MVDGEDAERNRWRTGRPHVWKHCRQRRERTGSLLGENGRWMFSIMLNVEENEENNCNYLPS